MSKEFWVKLRIIGWLLTFFWFMIYELNFWFALPTDLRQLAILRGIIGMLGTFLVLVGFYRLRQYDNTHTAKNERTKQEKHH